MERIKYKRFVLVRDNFYDHPEKVHDLAATTEYHQPEHSTGYRSKMVYHEPGVKSKLERIIGIKITRWDTDPEEENGVFYQGFSRGKKREVPGVHSDEPYNDITVLIYLTPDLPFDCGTSLWMHTATGLTDPAMPVDAKRLGRKITGLQQQFERESESRRCWTEIDRIGYRFNRMVAYPSGVFHSATNHYGGSSKNGRLYQTFRIGVDWNSLKMYKG